MAASTGAHLPSSVLKVSAKSNPNAVAGALAAVLRDHSRAELQAVGAGAINQAVKAIAIARTYLKGSEIDLVCVPSFIDIEIEGNERTGISLAVTKK
ncbi:MAG: stage V sporulation protein S [Candidatus Baltobacteraceae bacterium]